MVCIPGKRKVALKQRKSTKYKMMSDLTIKLWHLQNHAASRLYP